MRVGAAGAVVAASALMSVLWWLGRPASDSVSVVAAHVTETPRLGAGNPAPVAPPAAPPERTALARLAPPPGAAPARNEPAVPAPAAAAAGAPPAPAAGQTAAAPLTGPQAATAPAPSRPGVATPSARADRAADAALAAANPPAAAAPAAGGAAAPAAGGAQVAPQEIARTPVAPVAAPPPPTMTAPAMVTPSPVAPQLRPQAPTPQVAALPAPPMHIEPERRATVIDRAPAAAGALGPSFDIVRVERDGGAVIAGRATAGCTVTVTDADMALGSVRADDRGQWVIIPAEPLRPGSREIGLSQTCGEGAPATLSQQTVLLVVPERGKDVAGRDAPGPAEVMALAVERDGKGATFPLQVPAAARPEAAAPARAGVVLGAEAERAAAKLGVTLEAIDYDRDGRVVLSGRAAPGSQQRVYLENQPIGEAVADATGRWTLTPEATVAPGLYNLRVDLLRADGTVEARIEMPFLRGVPLTDLPPGSFVVVQPGNSLWRIARRTYGDGVRYGVIYQANAEQIRDPDLIYPGQIFTLPRRR